MKYYYLLLFTGLFFPLHGPAQSLFQGNENSKASTTPQGITIPEAPGEWRCDSIWESDWISTENSWFKYNRIFRTTDSQGRLRVNVGLKWDYIHSDWINNYKQTWDFFGTGTPRSFYEYVWNPSNGVWVETSQTLSDEQGRTIEIQDIIYDPATNKIIAGVRKWWDYGENGFTQIMQMLVVQNMTWVNNKLTIYTEDNSGNPLMEIEQTWNPLFNKWVNDDRTEYVYNSENKLSEYLESHFDSSTHSWINELKHTFEYNSSGKLAIVQCFEWDDESNSLKEHWKEEFNYNEAGLLVFFENKAWDEEAQEWVNFQKIVYTWFNTKVHHEVYFYKWIPGLSDYKTEHYEERDTAGLLIQQWGKSINMQTYEYYSGYREIREYNDGLLQTDTHQVLEPPDSWIDDHRVTNTWDGNRNRMSMLYETFNGTVWENSLKTDYFYSPYIGIPERQDLADLCYFRNPITPGSPIICPGLDNSCNYTFRLMNMAGQAIHTSEVRGGEPYQVPTGLTPGIYLLQITGDSRMVVSGRIVVL
jgi:hypothetical protein